MYIIILYYVRCVRKDGSRAWNNHNRATHKHLIIAIYLVDFTYMGAETENWKRSSETTLALQTTVYVARTLVLRPLSVFNIVR